MLRTSTALLCVADWDGVFKRTVVSTDCVCSWRSSKSCNMRVKYNIKGMVVTAVAVCTR